MIINHNLSAINADRNLSNSSVQLGKEMERLSSGLRISRAADDASGLAVSEKMRAQIRGLNQAERNINDGISFIQTAEGYLQILTESVQRIREMAVQASNGIYSDEDRTYLQIEVSQLIDEIDRVASQAQFNELTLFTGRFDANNNGTALSIHMGPNMDQQEVISIGNMTASGIRLAGANGEGGVILSDQMSANDAIGIADDSLRIINAQRANLGAYQNRLELAVKGQMIAAENLQSAESQIRDLNMASGVVSMTREQILNQSGVAMLAQANQKTAGILRLLN